MSLLLVANRTRRRLAKDATYGITPETLADSSTKPGELRAPMGEQAGHTALGLVAKGTSASATAAGKSDCAEATAKVVDSDASCLAYFDNTAVPSCGIGAGSLVAGSSCAYARQCGSQYCQLRDTAVCGKCTGTVGSGDVCGTTADCSSGLQCVTKGDAGTCRTGRAIDAGCTASPDCAAGEGCLRRELRSE